MNFSSWLSGVGGRGEVVKAWPGESLDAAMERARLESERAGVVTLHFNNMRVVYEKGQLRRDLSKLR